MNVMMTADAVGGVWTYAIDLAQALCATGASVCIVVLGPPPSAAQRCQAASIAGLRLFEHDYRLEWMPDSQADVIESGRWLRALADWLRPDVIHLNGYAHGAIDFKAPKIVVAHSCVLSWWRAVKDEDCPPQWRAYARAVGDGLAGADAIVAPTRSMAGALRECYGTAQPIQVIPNGRNTGHLGARPKRALVFSAGRMWDEAKNLGALDRAAARTPWPIYVAGDGAATTTGSDSTAGCIRLGRLSASETAEWMGHASIYAAPARYEPFGLSVLEAAWSRCALVLGDIPTLRELWDGVAWFAAPGDDDALVEALSEAARDTRLCEWRAHLARARARMYSLGRMVAEYRSLYAAVLNHRAPAGGPACAS